MAERENVVKLLKGVFWFLCVLFVINILFVANAVFYLKYVYFAVGSTQYTGVSNVFASYKYHLKEAILSLESLIGSKNYLCEVDLKIPKENLAKLDADVPKSIDEYVDGELVTKDDIYKIKVKYRGDTGLHWLHSMKSYKIKVDDSSKRYRNLEEFSFVLPETSSIVSESIAFQISREMRIFTQTLELMPVCLNGQYIGMYRYMDPIDKDLIEMKALPYSGLYIGKSNSVFGIDKNLYVNPYFWELRSKEDLSYSDYQDLFYLIKMIRDILNEDEGAYLNFMNIINFDYFARFAAVQTFFQTIHYDHQHNNKLYFDSTRGEFNPITDDPGAWFSYYNQLYDYVPVDILSNDLLSALHKNPEFIYLKQKYIWEMLSKYSSKEIDKRLWDVYNKNKEFIENDDKKGITIFIDVFGANTYLVKRIYIIQEAIKKKLSDQDICYVVDDNRLSISSYGESPKKISSVKFENGTVNFVRENGKDADLYKEIFYSGRKIYESKTIEIKKAMAEKLGARFFLTPSPMIYNFMSNANLVGRISSIEFQNLITGETFVKDAGKECPQEVDGEFMFHPWDLDQSLMEQRLFDVDTIFDDDPNGLKFLDHKNIFISEFVKNYPIFVSRNEELTLRKGTYKFDKTIIIPKGTKLTIAPGVRILMAPGVSFVSYSPVIAEGTKRSQIYVGAQDPENPFGVFALANEGASGSSFEYFNIENGNEATINGIYFSGMFDAYHNNNVVVENSSFKYAHADDALNFKYSNSSVKNSYFYKNSGDAIDFDVMTGEISGNYFEENGNDSIDVSFTTSLIKNNHAYKSGDKCISIGEHSTPLIFNNLLDGCKTGIEVKDLSEPVILNNAIVNNDMGINSYQKKEIFGGGHAKVWNTLFYNNKAGISFINTFKGKKMETDDSDIEINYSNIPGGYDGKGNIDEKISDGQFWIDGEGDLSTLKKYMPEYNGSIRIGLIDL